MKTTGINKTVYRSNVISALDSFTSVRNVLAWEMFQDGQVRNYNGVLNDLQRLYPDIDFDSVTKNVDPESIAANEDAIYSVVDDILNKLIENGISRDNFNYAIWACDNPENVADTYGVDIDDVSAYKITDGILLQDLGYEGQLYGVADYPEEEWDVIESSDIRETPNKQYVSMKRIANIYGGATDNDLEDVSDDENVPIVKHLKGLECTITFITGLYEEVDVFQGNTLDDINDVLKTHWRLHPVSGELPIITHQQITRKYNNQIYTFDADIEVKEVPSIVADGSDVRKEVIKDDYYYGNKSFGELLLNLLLANSFQGGNMETREDYKDYYLEQLIENYGNMTERDYNSAQKFCYDEEWNLGEVGNMAEAIDGLGDAWTEYQKQYKEGFEIMNSKNITSWVAEPKQKFDFDTHTPEQAYKLGFENYWNWRSFESTTVRNFTGACKCPYTNPELKKKYYEGWNKAEKMSVTSSKKNIKSSKAEELEMFEEESKYGNRSEFEDFKRNHPESTITYLDWRKYLNGYEDDIEYEYEDENGNMYTWDMIKKDIDDWVKNGDFKEYVDDALPDYIEPDGTPKYEKIYDDFWDIGSNGSIEYIGSSRRNSMIKSGLTAFDRAIEKKYNGTSPNGAGQYYLDWKYNLADEKDYIEQLADKNGLSVEFQTDEGYFEVFSSRRNNMKKTIKSVYTLNRNEIDEFEQASPDLGVKFDEPLLIVHDNGYIYNYEGFEKYINEITQLYPDNWEGANEAYHTDSIEEFIDMCESDWFRHDFGGAFDFYREGLKQMAESTISEVPADGQPFSIKNGFAFKLLGENETDFDVENPYWVDDYSLQRIDGFFCQINPSVGNQFDVVIDPDYFNVPEGESVVTSSRKPIKSSKWVEDVADKKGITFEQVLEVFKDNGYGEDEADDFWNSKWNDVSDAFGEDGIAGLDELFGIEITSARKSIKSSSMIYKENEMPSVMKDRIYWEIYYYNEDDNKELGTQNRYDSVRGMSFTQAKRRAKQLMKDYNCDTACMQTTGGNGVIIKNDSIGDKNMKIQSKRVIKSGTSNFGSNDNVYGYDFPLVTYVAENYYYDEETDSETEERDYEADDWEYRDAIDAAKDLADEMDIPQYDDYSEPYLCHEPFMIKFRDGYYEGLWIEVKEGTDEEDIYNTNEYGSYYDGGRPFTDEEMNKFADKLNEYFNKLCSDYGWQKLGVTARFSNGETMYHKIDNSRKSVISGLTFRQAVQDFKAAGQWNDYYEMQQDWEAYKDGLEKDGVISEKTRSTWGNPCTREGFKKWINNSYTMIQSRITQRELKDMIRTGQAIDITYDDAPEGVRLDVLQISKGTYGMNGALLKGSDGNLYVIGGRTTNLFRYV